MPKKRSSGRARAIVEKLKALREAAGISQRALSVRLNQHATYIYEIEAFQHAVRGDELMDICEALGARGSDVLREIEDEE